MGFPKIEPHILPNKNITYILVPVAIAPSRTIQAHGVAYVIAKGGSDTFSLNVQGGCFSSRSGYLLVDILGTMSRSAAAKFARVYGKQGCPVGN